MIPKIIHQMAPKDKSRWHPAWPMCQETWFRQYSDFEYQMWTEDRVIEFISEKYPMYSSTLKNTFEIIRIDIARFMILYEYGGIYADMDMYCYQNFYDDLTSPVCIVKSASKESVLENSLMASIPNHIFFKFCITASMNRLREYPLIKQQNDFDPEKVKFISGPKFLSEAYLCFDKKEEIYILPEKTYNQGPKKYNPQLKTRHLLTGLWGEDSYNNRMKEKKEKNFTGTDEEYLLHHYKWYRNVDLNKFERAH